jgi:hypothetical protein
MAVNRSGPLSVGYLGSFVAGWRISGSLTRSQCSASSMAGFVAGYEPCNGHCGKHHVDGCWRCGRWVVPNGTPSKPPTRGQGPGMRPPAAQCSVHYPTNTGPVSVCSLFSTPTTGWGIVDEPPYARPARTVVWEGAGRPRPLPDLRAKRARWSTVGSVPPLPRLAARLPPPCGERLAPDRNSLTETP